jgi:hypothetical protein
MKIRTLLSYLVVFLAGLAVSWFAKKPVIVVEEKQQVTRTSQHRSSQREKSTSKVASKNSRFNELLKIFTDSKYGPEKRSAAMEKVETSDLLLLMEGISQTAGLTGLDYHEISQIQKLLTEWGDRDFDAALAWVESIEHPRDRKQFFSVLIDLAAEKDLEKGIELVHKFGRNEDGDLKVPHNMMLKIVSLDAAQMIERMAQFAALSGSKGYLSVSGIQAKFPANYDFRKALDGIAELKSKSNGSSSLPFIPTNLMQEWAKTDPDAAWQWLGEGKNVDDNSVDEFLDSYCENATTEQTLQMLLKAGERFDSSEDHLSAAWKALASKKNAELFMQFLSQMPGNQQENLNLLFHRSRRSMGGDYDVSKSLLISQMSYDERMRVFSQEQDYLHHERKFYTPILQRLGHTEAEIQQMLPAKKSP